MDITTVFALVKSNVNPLTVTLLVLFIASEVMGSKDNIKASSFYGVFKAMLGAAIEQVKPTPVLAPAAAPAQVAATPQAPTA